MASFYNRIGGQSTERLAALSDGIFAFAMTLLVFDIHTPAAGAIHQESDLLHALVGLGPRGFEAIGAVASASLPE